MSANHFAWVERLAKSDPALEAAVRAFEAALERRRNGIPPRLTPTTWTSECRCMVCGGQNRACTACGKDEV
jgi:hypothetical protein